MNNCVLVTSVVLLLAGCGMQEAVDRKFCSEVAYHAGDVGNSLETGRAAYEGCMRAKGHDIKEK